MIRRRYWVAGVISVLAIGAGAAGWVVTHRGAKPGMKFGAKPGG